jgi:hypothetical protein
MSEASCTKWYEKRPKKIAARKKIVNIPLRIKKIAVA